MFGIETDLFETNLQFLSWAHKITAMIPYFECNLQSQKLELLTSRGLTTTQIVSSTQIIDNVLGCQCVLR